MLSGLTLYLNVNLHNYRPFQSLPYIPYPDICKLSPCITAGKRFSIERWPMRVSIMLCNQTDELTIQAGKG